MTLCIHITTKDALIGCSDGKVRTCFIKSDGSEENINFIYDDIKSYIYNDIVISVAGSSIYRKNERTVYEYCDFFNDLYACAPDFFDIRKFPSYLSYELFGSGRYDFGNPGCEFLVSGLSSSDGKYYIYKIYGDSGEIVDLTFRNYGICGIKSLADEFLSDLIITELSTQSVLKLLEFIVKIYCDYGKFEIDEFCNSDLSKFYRYKNSVGGKWLFYVFDFKTKKKKYVKFCADGKLRYYSKLVQNEFI